MAAHPYACPDKVAADLKLVYDNNDRNNQIQINQTRSTSGYFYFDETPQGFDFWHKVVKCERIPQWEKD